MLQVNTGKLFKNGVGHKNNLEAVLYSNAVMYGRSALKTDAGSILNTDSNILPYSYVYKLIERIEKEEFGGMRMGSFPVSDYLSEFCKLATFGLKVLFTPDYDTIERLTSKNSLLYMGQEKFVQRFFDNKVVISESEQENFCILVKRILNLDPKIYEKVIDSISTFVTAIHRIPDDPALAYTLLVSAIEILAGNSKKYKKSWEDVDEVLRRKLDPIFCNINHDDRNKIKDVLISNSYQSLSKKYVNFIVDMQNRKGVITENKNNFSIRKCDLPYLLRNAYSLRSQYIHSAKKLSLEFTVSRDWIEVIKNTEDRKEYLTLQGLIRITSQSIIEFIKISKKIPTNYDGNYKKRGVVDFELAAEQWISSRLFNKKFSDLRYQFDKLLMMLMAHRAGRTNTLPDMRSVNKEIELCMKQSKKPERITMFAMYILFHSIANEEYSSENFENFNIKFQEYGDFPAAENIILRTFVNQHDWDLSIHEKAYNIYWRERFTPTGIDAGRILEAAMALDIAERYRDSGKISKVKMYLKKAMEFLPESIELCYFVEKFSMDKPIDWTEILLHHEENNETIQN